MKKHHEALPRSGQGGTIAIALVSLACMAPSATVNAMHQLAHTPGPLAFPLAMASILSVALAAASPFAIERAIATRNVALFLVALLAGGVCLAYNLAAAVGAASTTRAEIVGVRAAENTKATLLASQLAQAEKSRATLAAISQEKTPGMVEAELKGMEQATAWTTSKQCTDATLPASRQFCTGYADKQAALDAAKKVETLDREIADTKAKLLATTSEATGQPTDPQAANIAAALSFIGGNAQPANIGIALNLWLALLVEVLGAFGPMMFAAVLRHQPIAEVPHPAAPCETDGAAPSAAKCGKVRQSLNIKGKNAAEDAAQELRHDNVIPLVPHRTAPTPQDIEAAVRRCGSQRAAAKTLGISERTLRRIKAG